MADGSSQVSAQAPASAQRRCSRPRGRVSSTYSPSRVPCSALSALIGPLSHFSTALAAALPAAVHLAATCGPLAAPTKTSLLACASAATVLTVLLRAVDGGRVRLSEADALRLGAAGITPLHTLPALMHVALVGCDLATRGNLDPFVNHFECCCDAVVNLVADDATVRHGYSKAGCGQHEAASRTL